MFFGFARSIRDVKLAQKKNSPSPSQRKDPALSGRVPTDPVARKENKLPIIEEMKDIPAGTYQSWEEADMPLAFNRVGAVIRGENERISVLIAREAYGTPAHMEIIQRLKKSNVRHELCSMYLCSGELLRSIHRKHESEAVKRVDSTDVERSAWALIDRAVDSGASDLHIETRGAFAQVFFRIHGERVEQANMSAETATAIANVLYTVHADSSSKGVAWSRDEVKDTSIERVTHSGRQVQVRFHTAPIHPSGNFQMVCRLLTMDEKTAKHLPDIGYTENQVRVLEDMIVGAQGLVLLVGPTNSGKSTSMQSIARRIRERRGATMKLVTVEDPVEYIISGACQMGVSHGRKQLEDDTGSVYNTLLKATLREDPDAVIVGEIRDSQSAATVKNLVLAGRKIIATLHVFEAMAVFSRLREIGLPDSVLYMPGFISGIIYQRLVPTLCPHCAVPILDAVPRGAVDNAVYERVSRVLDLSTENVRVRSPGGCEHCNHMGISGRTICAEILPPDPQMLDYLRRGDNQHARDYWMQNDDLNVLGMGVSAVAHGISKVACGLIDPHDLESQVGMIRADRASGVAVGEYGGGGWSEPMHGEMNHLASIYQRSN